MRGMGLAILSVALLGGCSSIVEGRSQEIVINTTPAGATCTLNREGAPIGKVSPTPGAVIVTKDKYDIDVVCELDGYQKTAYLNESGTAAAVFGNIVLGGLVGVVVDSATGADNKYDSPLDIALTARTDMSAPVSLPVVTSAPLPPPPATGVIHSASAAMPPAAVTVDLRRAENAAERYRVLRRLAADGLVPQDRYDAWARQNMGVFLLTTAAPPSAAASSKPPLYRGLADFLRSLETEKNRGVAEAEREALFRALMPMDGPRALPLKPPADYDGLQTWYAFLDRVRDEGLVPAESIEAEKAAINDARIAAAG